MIRHTASYGMFVIILIAAAAMGLALFGSTPPALAHGGKSHGDSEFTRFQAVQKAVQLYDRLIAAEKLDDAWETGLAEITVDTRQHKGKKEYVVRFKRSTGEPDRVYFFFDLKGEYAGSNFSGN